MKEVPAGFVERNCVGGARIEETRSWREDYLGFSCDGQPYFPFGSVARDGATADDVKIILGLRA